MADLLFWFTVRNLSNSKEAYKREREIKKLPKYMKDKSMSLTDIYQKIPAPLQPFILVPYWFIHPRRKKVFVKPESGVWKVIKKGNQFFVPSPIDAQRDFGLLDNYEKHYSVKKGDVVVDIGAYIGEFSL